MTAVTEPRSDPAELVRILRAELRAELASWPDLANVREGREERMTTPIDDMSLGQATAEILQQVRGMDERLDVLTAKLGAGGASKAAAIGPNLVDNLLRSYGHLVKNLARLQSRLETVEERLGIDPNEELRKKLRQLGEKGGGAP
jgi:hypothetical protein